MGAVTDHGPLILDDPGVHIHAINHAGRRHHDPELSVAPFLAVGAGAVARLHVGWLRAASLDDAHAARIPASSSGSLAPAGRRFPRLAHLFRNRTAALR